jgi:hypothetical protein
MVSVHMGVYTRPVMCLQARAYGRVACVLHGIGFQDGHHRQYCEHLQVQLGRLL